MRCYRIGNLNIGLNCSDYPIQIDNLTGLFEEESATSATDIFFEIQEMKPVWFEKSKCVQHSGGYELLDTENGMFLMNHWAHCRYGYGFWLDDLKNGDRVPVYFNPAMQNQIPIAIVRLLSTIGLHSKFLQKGAPIIHASYIEYEGNAILFTAPSGTGKSTQAELWNTYAKAEIINGDRVLVRKMDHQWRAYGYPCCGSSCICKNETHPIRAIVVLEQGTENRVESMTAPQKIRALVSATEVYPWDMDEIDLAFQCAQKMIESIPVIRLICRPDEEAVRVLQNYLETNDDAECV